MTQRTRQVHQRRLVQTSRLPPTLPSLSLPQAKPSDLEGGVSGKLTDETKISSIDIGDSLPPITLKNEKGEDVDVPGLAAERGVVLFLVPKADTRQSMILTTVVPL
jgi:hypothetical protein